MLSVVRKEVALDMTNTADTPPSPRGFGKMLDSLQGLQQRLEDFSIADITAAETNAQTLILSLKQIQNIVTAISLLKTAGTDISESDPVHLPDTEFVGLDSLEKHPQLHAVIKASKLIKLHKMVTALRAVDNNSTSSERQTAAEPSITKTPAEVSSSVPGAFNAIEPRTAATNFASTPEFVEDLTSTLVTVETGLVNVETAETPIATETAIPPDTYTAPPAETVDSFDEFPAADAEFETANTSRKKPRSRRVERLREDFPAAAEESIHIRSKSSSLKEENATNLPTAVKPKKTAQITLVTKPGAPNKDAQVISDSEAAISGKESFDLRLLNDLVTNYGEFASSPNLPATLKQKELQLSQPAATDPHEIPGQFSAVDSSAPTIKSNGDLDRQLKKLIKDYGEYDLYSDKQSTNLKKAGILAFVFLGLVFGGIYFFKAPASTKTIAPASASSNSTSTDQKSHVTDEKLNADGRETPSH